MKTPRVKICCIGSVAEAQLAIKYGASALGLVGPMPSGPGVIASSLAHEIVRAVPPPISTFLLTSETTASRILAHHQKVPTSTIQLVDEIATKEYAVLRSGLPGVKLVQVIHVLNEGSIAQAQKAAEFADAILLDSGNPGLPVKSLGGTGNTHDWQLSVAIKKAIDIPIFLAGGIKPDNVRDAVQTVKPHGIDLCSGVRTNGKLNENKLRAFFEELKKA